MRYLRLLFFILFGSILMYAIAWALTKDQREYLSVPTRDELMARDCRMALIDFDMCNSDAFDFWESLYGQGFITYAALRTIESTQLRYGHRPTLKGWHEYNASR